MFNEDDIYHLLDYNKNMFLVYDPDTEKFCFLNITEGSIIPGCFEYINIEKLIKWDKNNNFLVSL